MIVVSLAGEALIEAIDGPTPAGSLEGKSMPVLTRLSNGRIGFRIMGRFSRVSGLVPLVRVSFENGRTVRVSRDQVFFRKPMIPVPAADLKADDRIEVCWDYREGYRPPDLPEHRPSDGTLLVQGVAPEGEGEAFSAPVRETGVFFLTCGALLKA